jgi:hypothetical protein
MKMPSEEGKSDDGQTFLYSDAHVKSSRSGNFTDSACEKKVVCEKFWKKSLNPLFLCFENEENEKKFQEMHKEKGRRVFRVWSVLLILLTCIVHFQTLPNIYMSEFAWRACNIALALANLCFVISVNTKIWGYINIEVSFFCLLIYFFKF